MFTLSDYYMFFSHFSFIFSVHVAYDYYSPYYLHLQYIIICILPPLTRLTSTYTFFIICVLLMFLFKFQFIQNLFYCILISITKMHMYQHLKLPYISLDPPDGYHINLNCISLVVIVFSFSFHYIV